MKLIKNFSFRNFMYGLLFNVGVVLYLISRILEKTKLAPYSCLFGLAGMILVLGLFVKIFFDNDPCL
jgi:hypothetical protein